VLTKYPLRLSVTRSTDFFSHTLFNMPYIIQNLFIVREKETSSFVIILVILVTSNILYFQTNSNSNFVYAQVKSQYSHAGVKIVSPAMGQKVPVGQLVVSGASTDNATTDCQVYVDVNDIKPMQNTTAAGVGGRNDYSNWTFTYTSKYYLISEGINELTAKLSCINNPANITKYYSVNVTGVATSLAAAHNTTATTKNVTMENNNNNNNQAKVSTDTVNQIRKQTPQQEPKYELQSESGPPANSASQLLKETQKQEEAQKESNRDGQIAELSTSEVVPLGKSSDLNSLTKEPEVEDEEKLTESTEPAGELLDYSHDQEQIDEDELKSTETSSQPQDFPEQQPLEVQEVPPEIIEQQPLEEDPPLETSSQPQDFPEQQPLEADQHIDESPVQSFGHKTQPSQLGIQPLEEQPVLSNQQVPESRLSAQEQHMQEQSVKNVQGDKQAYEKDESVPFVLPFDSQDITPGS
jgi:hypothetical protein